MNLRKITLQHFRNIGLAEVELRGRQQFFLGPNGQGKTNLLEAIGYITALRSFRTADPKLLVEQEQPEAALACELTHERLGETRVVIKLRSGEKEVFCDGVKVTKFGEYLGRFPTVVFSSQDQQLVRGSPSGRRRWLDLTFAAMHAGYLLALQNYHRALLERNKLLKDGAVPAALEAFERPLAQAAMDLTTRRADGVKLFDRYVRENYSRIAPGVEEASVGYAPNAEEPSEHAWRTLFFDCRSRDGLVRTTTRGPHRDELELRLGGRSARDYGSEGQQRSLVLALRMAQAAFYREHSGVEPVLLADDVLGELDPVRRKHFWAAVGEAQQVIATGTSLVEAEAGTWQVFTVERGTFQATA